MSVVVVCIAATAVTPPSRASECRQDSSQPGCTSLLKTDIADLWKATELLDDCQDDIIDVHKLSAADLRGAAAQLGICNESKLRLQALLDSTQPEPAPSIWEHPALWGAVGLTVGIVTGVLLAR